MPTDVKNGKHKQDLNRPKAKTELYIWLEIKKYTLMTNWFMASKEKIPHQKTNL